MGGGGAIHLCIDGYTSRFPSGQDREELPPVGKCTPPNTVSSVCEQLTWARHVTGTMVAGPQLRHPGGPQDFCRAGPVEAPSGLYRWQRLTSARKEPSWELSSLPAKISHSGCDLILSDLEL